MSTRTASNTFISLLKDERYDDQYFSFEAETDTQRIIENLAFTERLFPDRVLMLCNRSHPKLQYVGSNCYNIFGFDHEEFKNLDVQNFFALIHPEDLEGLKECFDFISSAEPYEPLTHRFVLHYRLKVKGGRYIHIRDEKAAIKTDTGKYIYFTMFKDITLHEKFFNVKLEVFKQVAGGVLKVCRFNPTHSSHVFTPRQKEIIKLIIRGFSTQEIADTLNVSINTIKNHKQSLFRKVRVKSSVELINFASNQ